MSCYANNTKLGQYCILPKFKHSLFNICLNKKDISIQVTHIKLGGGGVQGQGKGQRLMSNIAVNDYSWLATCQGNIYEK